MNDNKIFATKCKYTVTLTFLLGTLVAPCSIIALLKYPLKSDTTAKLLPVWISILAILVGLSIPLQLKHIREYLINKGRIWLPLLELLNFLGIYLVSVRIYPNLSLYVYLVLTIFVYTLFQEYNYLFVAIGLLFPTHITSCIIIRKYANDVLVAENVAGEDNILISFIALSIACVWCIFLIKMQKLNVKTRLDAVEKSKQIAIDVKEHLRNIINSTSEYVKESSMSINNVTIITEKVNESSNDVTASVNSVANDLTDMDGATLDVNKEIEATVNIVNELIELIQQSDIAMAKCDAIIDEFKEKSLITNNNLNDASIAMQNMNEYVQTVQGVTNIIKNIADETSLLSLNASIEAARAGSSGAGFAVVASSIGNLAKQTTESVKKINDMLTELKSRTTQVANQIEVVTKDNSTQNELVEKMALAAKSVLEIDDKNTVKSCALLEKTRKVSEDSEKIATSITNISAVAEEIAASMEEFSESCQTIFKEIKNVDSSITDIYQKLTDNSLDDSTVSIED